LDRRPPELPSTSSRLIAMAVSLVGDVETVRQKIGSSPADFRDYCAGQKEPPWPELDRLITLIVREQGQLIARNRELLAEIRARMNKGS
jgi:hypothetical protein